jgi:hypothetical protein
VKLDELIQSSGEWLRGEGPEADIVISTRIRLARNLSQFPFLTRADDAAKAEIERILHSQITRLAPRKALNYFDVTTLQRLDRQFLVERQLISRELAEGHGPRGVAFSDAENASLMVNEEDHLRIQVIHSGLALEECWKEINQIDDMLEEQVTFAFSQQLGYLTACPTNCGTGIRTSVMLHLPALVQTKEIQKVFQALQKIGLAVRGLYGEGSQAMGDFYQISNQEPEGCDPQHHRLRTPRPWRNGEREQAGTARPGFTSLRDSEIGPDDHLRRDHAASFQPAHGNQLGADRRPADSNRQRAVYLHPASSPAEAATRGPRFKRTQHCPGQLLARAPRRAELISWPQAFRPVRRSTSKSRGFVLVPHSHVFDDLWPDCDFSLVRTSQKAYATRPDVAKHPTCCTFGKIVIADPFDETSPVGTNTDLACGEISS